MLTAPRSSRGHWGSMLVLAAACGPASADTEAGAGLGESDAADDSSAPTPDECTARREDAQYVVLAFECASNPSSACCLDTATKCCSDALPESIGESRAVLEALRDRLPGWYDANYYLYGAPSTMPLDDPDYLAAWSVDVVIDPSGDVDVAVVTTELGMPASSVAATVELRSAEFFDACLASLDAEEWCSVAECLRFPYEPASCTDGTVDSGCLADFAVHGTVCE